MKNKRILLGTAIVLTAINLLNTDLSAYQKLSLADLLPVIAIASISFLLKTGVLSGLLIGIRKVWERLKS